MAHVMGSLYSVIMHISEEAFGAGDIRPIGLLAVRPAYNLPSATEHERGR
jgi:hypothetical protein